MRGRPVESTGTPVVDEFLVNSTVAGDQSESSIAALNNSTWVVTFTDHSTPPDGDILFRRFDFDGNPIGNDVPVVVVDTSFDDTRPDVTALADGGFAIAFQRNFGSSDADILLRRFNADGTENGSFITVDQSTLLDTNTPSIAGLASGGFVVAWTQNSVVGIDTSVWFQRYDASGAPIGGHVLVDGAGGINDDIQVAALQDGGFVVAYRENSWDLTGSDITVQFYNADGTPRSGHLRVNDNDPSDELETFPSLTVLSNGFVVVGWKEDFVHVMRQQAYNPAGFAAGTNYQVDGSVIEGEIAALTSGLVADVYTSGVPDQGGAGGFSIRHSIHELSRTVLSDGAGDTLVGDSLRDTLLGDGGNDLLIPGGANDFVDGGTGLDTVSYADATQTVIVDLPYHIALGAEIGTDTLAKRRERHYRQRQRRGRGRRGDQRARRRRRHRYGELLHCGRRRGDRSRRKHWSRSDQRRHPPELRECQRFRLR